MVSSNHLLRSVRGGCAEIQRRSDELGDRLQTILSEMRKCSRQIRSAHKQLASKGVEKARVNKRRHSTKALKAVYEKMQLTNRDIRQARFSLLMLRKMSCTMFSHVENVLKRDKDERENNEGKKGKKGKKGKRVFGGNKSIFSRDVYVEPALVDSNNRFMASEGCVPFVL